MIGTQTGKCLAGVSTASARTPPAYRGGQAKIVFDWEVRSNIGRPHDPQHIAQPCRVDSSQPTTIALHGPGDVKAWSMVPDTA
jgi:hypothetical protein